MSGDIASAALRPCPREEVSLYDRSPRSFETRLSKQLHQVESSENVFRREFKAVRHVLLELGACASDLVWRRTLLQTDTGRSLRKGYDASVNDVELTVRDIIKNCVFSMPNLDPSSRGFNVTPKFARLMQILKSCEPYGESFRGIVFVQRRAIARAMADLLRTSPDHIGFLRPYVVCSSGSPQLQEIFRGFESGTYNLLIATKSIEDLNVPKASMVIRFDLFESQVSYAYARACTRGRESHLIHMVERDNNAHRRILSQVTDLDRDMQRWTDTICRSQESSIPPPTLHESMDPYHSDSDEEQEDFIEDPITRRRLYVRDALVVIYRFAASLSVDLELASQPLFKLGEIRCSTQSRSSDEHCTIILPGFPIHGISGSHSFSKSLARRTACFNACRELHQKGFLDYRFFPIITTGENPESGGIGVTAEYSTEQSSLPLPAVNAENHTLGIRCYLRKTPDFWLCTKFAPIMSLYPTVISVNHSNSSSEPYASMLMLSRRPLPSLEPFKLFFFGIPAVINLTSCAELQLDEVKLVELYKYTMRICRSVANKAFDCPLNRMAYFFAPLSSAWTVSTNSRWELPSVLGHIPWHLVSLGAEAWAVELRSDDINSMSMDINDAVVQDRWAEFTKRYDVVKMRPDLNPLSKPMDSPREKNYENMFAYYKARCKGVLSLRNYKQPLIEVKGIPPVLNRLDPTSWPLDASDKAPVKYLIPELCAKFTIPASTWRTALLLPSITRRIDDLLLVKELNAKLFDHVIPERLLHMAISAPSAGIEYDYERLELFGDAFLKYLSSIYVFVTNPTQNESSLHIARQRIINNKALMQHAFRSRLPEFIQAKPFVLRSWQPPNFVVAPSSPKSSNLDVSGGRSAVIHTQSSIENDCHTEPLEDSKSFPLQAVPITQESLETAENQRPNKRTKKQRQQDERNVQWLGDKTIADVVEAIIGAAFISGGRDIALRVAKALHSPLENIERWSDFGRNVSFPPEITAKLKPGTIQAVEDIVGHKFQRPHLLAQALTHASARAYESNSYERFEFIGDAILDFMVVRYLFDRYGQLSPGGLTLLKGGMVSNCAIAAVCVSTGLHAHILLESRSLANGIKSYVNQIKTRQDEEYALAREEGRSPGQYWSEIEPPKALSDVFESIIGAIYISDGFSPIGTETLFNKLLKPFYDKHVTLKTLSYHPTKILLELAQAQGCQQFGIIKENDGEIIRCDVVVHEVVLASATDSTASFATRRVSLLALDALEGDPQFLTRTCDCRKQARGKKAQKKAKGKMLSILGEDDDSIGADSR